MTIVKFCSEVCKKTKEVTSLGREISDIYRHYELHAAMGQEVTSLMEGDVERTRSELLPEMIDKLNDIHRFLSEYYYIKASEERAIWDKSDKYD